MRRVESHRWVVVAVVIAAALAVAPAARSEPAPVPCADWPVAVSYDRVNAGGPDTQAAYWALAYAGTDGGRVRVHGEFPRARYFSLTVQDETQTTLGSLRDDDLDPDPGGHNPYRDVVTDDQIGTYTAFLDFGNPPAGEPAPNTFYTGTTLNGEPNVSGSLLLRIYVPTDQSDPYGGVPLPTVTLEGPGGTAVPLSFGSCTPVPPSVGNASNDLLAGTALPPETPRTQPLQSTYGPTPSFTRLGDTNFHEPIVTALPEPARSAVPERKGVPLANADFPYLISYISRYYGDVVVVRLAPPTFPDTVAGEPVVGPHQVRYWSVCTFSSIQHGGLRTYGCLTDFHATTTAPDGNVYVVVSDAAHQPALDLGPGVYWLPIGPSSENNIFYRVGVPSAGWTNSPLRIDLDAPDQVAEAQRVMGAYYPDGRYCAVGQIEREGAASCFAEETDDDGQRKHRGERLGRDGAGRPDRGDGAGHHQGSTPRPE